jgi:hypothetical protein
MASSKSTRTVHRQAQSELAGPTLAWFVGQDLLTADEVGATLGLAPPSRQVARWRERGQLVGLPVSRGHVYPAFQIDADRSRLQPWAVLINIRMHRLGDPWRTIEALWAARSGPGG